MKSLSDAISTDNFEPVGKELFCPTELLTDMVSAHAGIQFVVMHPAKDGYVLVDGAFPLPRLNSTAGKQGYQMYPDDSRVTIVILHDVDAYDLLVPTSKHVQTFW